MEMMSFRPSSNPMSRRIFFKSIFSRLPWASARDPRSQAPATLPSRDALSVESGSGRIDAFIQERGLSVLPSDESPAASTPIKCLVFSDPDGGDPGVILVILRLEDRVAERALAAHLGVPRSRLSMAPRSQLLEKVGWAAGEVPPFGHRQPLRTIMDSQVLESPDVIFGWKLEYRMLGEELQRATAAEVAAISVAAASAASDDGNFSNGGLEGASSSSGEEFEGKRGVLAALPSPWLPKEEEMLMEVMGIVAQKRKVANLLTFLNVVPPSAGPLPRIGRSTSAAYLRRLWAHPDSGVACELQLILGKTLEKRLGRPAAAALFKALRPGQSIRVTGRPQAHVQPADGQSRGHVVDMVVHQLEILSQPEWPLSEEEAAAEEEAALVAELDAAVTAKAAYDPDMALYELKITPENVVMVSDMAGIERMASILLAHHQRATTADPAHQLEDEHAQPPVAPPAPLPSRRRRHRRLNSSGEVERKDGLSSWRPALVVGMDCEWRPTSREEPKTPVSLLQIGCATHVFLIDMLAICEAPAAPAERIALTAAQSALSNCLEALFGDARVLKMGFGLRYDCKRLAESYPYLPCFGGPLMLPPQQVGERAASKQDTAGLQESHEGNSSDEASPSPALRAPFYPPRSVPFRGHVDALSLARAVGDGSTSYKRLGLASLSRLVLGVTLDKQEQRSDWGARPLSPPQLQYAAADVASLVDIFDALAHQNPDIWAPAGTDYFANQLTDFALLRARSAPVDRPDYDDYRRGRGAQGSGLPWQAQVTARGGPRSTAAMQCNVGALMRYLGGPVPDGGKLAVMRLAASPLDGEEPGTSRTPHFPRGSGVLQFANAAFLLFVNVPSVKYPNEFTVRQVEANGGSSSSCEMTWWPGKGQTLAHPVIRTLLGSAGAAMRAKSAAAAAAEGNSLKIEGGEGEERRGADESVDPTVLLFCRPQRADYVCCGRLEVASLEELDGQLRVSWRLADFDQLEESPNFQQILKLVGARTVGEEEEEGRSVDSVPEVVC